MVPNDTGDQIFTVHNFPHDCSHTHDLLENKFGCFVCVCVFGEGMHASVVLFTVEISEESGLVLVCECVCVCVCVM